MRTVWRQLAPRHVRAIVNGGNCHLRRANWVHYLHAAYVPITAGSIVRRSKGWLVYARDLAAEQRALRDARVVICNSRRTQEDVVARTGVDASRTHVVYYGSDPVRFLAWFDRGDRGPRSVRWARGPDRPLVGFVGALGDRRKGFDTVFRAWTELCQRPTWDADLIVVGWGAELSDWQRRAREAGLDRIRFAGARRDIPDVLAALDALVHPPRYEAYGLSVHEALCRGVPALG